MAQRSRQRGGGGRIDRSGRRVCLLAAIPLALCLLLTGSPQHGVTPAVASASIPPEVEAVRSCEIEDSSVDLPTDVDRSSRVLLGLAAHACDDPQNALGLLDLAPSPGADLEDWRLLALARAAVEAEDLETAAAAADRLLIDHGDSPLRHRSFVLRTQIAQQAGESERALSMARSSRAAAFPEDLRIELALIAWESARELELTEELEREAGNLLLHAPLEAIDVDAGRILAGDSGELDWDHHFEAWELSLRARRLVELDLIEDAIETLDAVSTEERNHVWRMIRAAALIEDRRGAEAYRTLEGIEATAPEEATELAWLRADAALDAATARRGRQNLPVGEREEMRQRARGHLREVTELSDDDELTVAALRRLFDEISDDDDVDDIQSVLTRLREIEPRDTTGTRHIWRRGWEEYIRQDYEDARKEWARLTSLYPESRYSRSGLYWTARSLEAEGRTDEATEIFEGIADAPATDYYRKHALIRLGRELGSPPEADSPERDWPSDPALSRASRLSDLGVDKLGLEELELLVEEADPEAVEALRSRILARQGRRRESIQSLWRVFPILGTPAQVEAPAEALRMYYPVDFLDIVERFAADNRLEVPLLMAMIRQESAFDTSARSWAGARGLMQVMPATGRELAERMGLRYTRERLNEPSFSVQIGSRYFRQVLDMFDGNVELALAGYNAGPYRIRKLVRAAGPNMEMDSFLEGLRIEESKTYVKRVVLFSNSYRQLYPDLG